MRACFYKSSASPPPNQALHVFCGNGSCGPRPRMPVSSQEHSFAERVINQNLGPNETSDRTLTVTESAQAPLSGNERQEQGSRCLTQRGEGAHTSLAPLLPFVSSCLLPPFLYHSYRIPDCCPLRTLVVPKPDSSVALHLGVLWQWMMRCVWKGGGAVQRLVKAKPCVQRGPFKSWPVAGYPGYTKQGQQPFLTKGVENVGHQEAR